MPMGNISTLIDQIPGYPARIMPTSDGGAVLSVFAPRNRLVELVLQEKHYRYDMMETVSARLLDRSGALFKS